MSKIEPTQTKTLRAEFARKLRNVVRWQTRHTLAVLKQVQQEYTLHTFALEDTLDKRLTPIKQQTDAKWRGHARTYTRRVYRKGHKDAQRELAKVGVGTPRGGFTQQAINQLVAHNMVYAKKATQSFKNDCIGAMARGIRNGHGYQKIARAVRDAAGTTRNRATLIARTETIRAYNSAHLTLYKKRGLKYYQWIAAAGPRTCARCMDKDGSVFAIGKGYPRPPLHPNCRCSVAPYIPESEHEARVLAWVSTARV